MTVVGGVARGAAIALGVVLVSWPAQGWALCPNCLGQTETLTPSLKLLGVFLALPFAIAYVVFRVIRRACRRG